MRTRTAILYVQFLAFVLPMELVRKISVQNLPYQALQGWLPVPQEELGR
jgi:hypothetical protein